VGFLFRHAPPPAVKAGVRAVLADAVARPSTERIHGAGTLLAEASVGVGNGLHSRAGAVLGPLLISGTLGSEDFRAASGEAAPGLGGEEVEARVAAVAAVCLEHLLEHTRCVCVGVLALMLPGAAAVRWWGIWCRSQALHSPGEPAAPSAHETEEAPPPRSAQDSHRLARP
jgi:hypothetical protein